MSTPSTTYTAARLALALQRSKRGVLRRLGGVPAVTLHGPGGAAQSWPLSALPAEWQKQLALDAERHGCRNVEHYLKQLAEPWQPRDARNQIVPLAKIDQRWIDRATQLRDALAEPLQRQHEFTDDRPGLITKGLEKFKETVRPLTAGLHTTGARAGIRQSIGAKQWERLFTRTIARDKGNEDWSRLEIYLDEPAFLQAAPPKPTRAQARFSHHELDPVVAAIKKIKSPTAEDLNELFHCAFLRLEILRASHPAPDEQRAAKSSLIRHVFAQGLPLSGATDPDDQRRLFDRKFAQWIACGRTIDGMDTRKMKSGNFRTPDFTPDYREISKATIVAGVGVNGCNESGARRQAEDDGKLRPEFLQHSPCNRRTNKSGGLTKKGRRIVTAMSEATIDLYRGPKAARDSGPHIVRNWKGERPGDWFVLDDVTLEFYWRPDGAGTEPPIRGECLVGTDAVSDYPLCHLLIPDKYNGQHIRQLIKAIHTSVGLPRKGFILEGGVWRSRFVQGEQPGHGWNETHWREVVKELTGRELRIGDRQELGINDPRLELTNHHATTPGAKPIESVFKRVQSRMCRLPLHVGSNEREARMERVQKLKDRASRGDTEALAQFWTQKEMNAAVIAELDAFAHDPGNGDRLKGDRPEGQSPAEAWHASMIHLALRKLTPQAEILLSTHEKIVTLKPRIRGFETRLPGRKTPVCYVNEHTEALLFKGETHLRVRIDIDNPQLATCCDMKGTTRFLVKGQMAEAMSATREDLKDLAKQRRASRTQSVALLGEIKHEVRAFMTRDNDHDEQLAEEAEFHRAKVEAHKAEEQADTRKRRKIHREAPGMGHVHNPDRVLAGIEMEKEALAELEAENRCTSTTEL